MNINVIRKKIIANILEKKVDSIRYIVQTVYSDASHAREVFDVYNVSRLYYERKIGDPEVIFCQLVMYCRFGIMKTKHIKHYYKHMSYYIHQGQPRA